MDNIDYNSERLLIISNNVLSLTKNNGKTILSFVDGLKSTNIRQLYFSTEIPEVGGCKYFSITNRDVIRGKFSTSRRGGEQIIDENDSFDSTKNSELGIKKNNTTKLIRELLWKNSWKSPKLLEWLDCFKPTAVFFVAGDAVFAYEIYTFIVKRYSAKGSIYITDDYITTRNRENVLYEIHRKLIIKNLKDALALTKSFFTISTVMQSEYLKLLNRSSHLIVNMTELMLNTSVNVDSNYLIYTGSLYYGRDEVLGEIGKAINNYNDENSTHYELCIYSNVQPDEETLKKITINNGSKYCGSLTKAELIVELNKAAFLVFVESFDEDQIEKTKFSLSTKVPEYLSLGKPILAIGPSGIGSIEYLKGVSFLIDDKMTIREKVSFFLSERCNKDKICEAAKEKYRTYHEKKTAQQRFYQQVFKEQRGRISNEIN